MNKDKRNNIEKKTFKINWWWFYSLYISKWEEDKVRKGKAKKKEVVSGEIEANTYICWLAKEDEDLNSKRQRKKSTQISLSISKSIIRLKDIWRVLSFLN